LTARFSKPKGSSTPTFETMPPHSSLAHTQHTHTHTHTHTDLLKAVDREVLEAEEIEHANIRHDVTALFPRVQKLVDLADQPIENPRVHGLDKQQ
jgi:hypothetical protein